MTLRYRHRPAAALLLLALGAAACAGRRAATPTASAPLPELRALWVDGFRRGIRSAAEVDALVAAARAANLNTLFVQVRRRGDALYTRGFEPPVDDPSYDPAFDGLDHLAHVEVSR